MHKIRNILFVCTGNICRSPMAEAVMKARLESLDGGQGMKVASAGTHNYHIGETPDYRTIQMCTENGIDASNIRASQISAQDYETYDLILGMDKSHVTFLLDKCPENHRGKIHLFMEYAGLGKLEVPDPYYGGMEDFLQVYEMVSKGSGALFGIIAGQDSEESTDIKAFEAAI